MNVNNKASAVSTFGSPGIEKTLPNAVMIDVNKVTISKIAKWFEVPEESLELDQNNAEQTK